MLSEKEITRISKFLSLVLRHKPEILGMTLDENGWTDVQTLLYKINQTDMAITRDILRHVVETNAKKRFAFNETGDKIRASQGHSVEIKLDYTPQQPPGILFHGTGEKSVTSILKTGLEKKDRHHVHLSADRETALKVGQRHGKPVVLEVSAGQMAHEGHTFYVSENDVWLTDHVPVRFLAVRK
jgi:putative RNA 2'-phosphotransferase